MGLAEPLSRPWPRSSCGLGLFLRLEGGTCPTRDVGAQASELGSATRVSFCETEPYCAVWSLLSSRPMKPKMFLKCQQVVAHKHIHCGTAPAHLALEKGRTGSRPALGPLQAGHLRLQKLQVPLLPGVHPHLPKEPSLAGPRCPARLSHGTPAGQARRRSVRCLSPTDQAPDDWG